MIGVGVGIEEILGLFDVERACTLGSVTLSICVAMGAVVGTFDGVSYSEMVWVDSEVSLHY